MKKQQLVTTGIMTALLASNVILGYQYKTDTDKLDSKIHKQYELIKYKEKKIDKRNIEINKQFGEINQLNESIKSKNKLVQKLKKDLEKAKKRNESPSEQLTMEVTAYTEGYESTQKKKGDKGYGITASGAKAKEGVTIACPKSMEFGTKIFIDGVGERTCEDRGGLIKEGHLDVYIESLNEAKKFGRRNLKVKINK